MRTTRLVAGWSAIVLISGAGAGCAAGTRYAPDGLRADAGLTESTPQERRALKDSARAQEVADEVGPRVSVMADFDDASGSRRVDATFHMYDDAYVIVGHLDASGRLSIVFPSTPGDDGFVRGDEIYHVPSFFAGFGDEYAWRYSNYRYSTHSAASRYNSYDAGLGYVFVIASWRPMRLDRVTNGNKWESYEVSDISYMSDPREAIEELGSLIAGDNREAYTIEYAHYTTTNYGTYAYSDFDRYYSSCSAYGASPLLGYNRMYFSPFGWSPSAGFGFNSFGCGNGMGYGGYYGLGYPFYASPGQAPAIRPRLPLGTPILHLPHTDPNGLALHMPQRGSAPTTAGNGGGVGVNGSIYRRPGLIAEDAAGPRGHGERQSAGTQATFASHRPSIQEMIGTRSPNEAARDIPSRGMGMSTGPSAWTRPNGNSGVTRGGESTHWSDGGRQMTAGQGGRSYGGQQAHSAPRGETRGEAMHAAPAHASPSTGHAAPAPTHAEPARSAPAPASSSSGSKKP